MADQETRDAAEKYWRASEEVCSACGESTLWVSERDAFLAGDAHGRTSERTRILEMLRSEEQAGGKHYADWLEEKLTKVVEK